MILSVSSQFHSNRKAFSANLELCTDGAPYLDCVTDVFTAVVAVILDWFCLSFWKKVRTEVLRHVTPNVPSGMPSNLPSSSGVLSLLRSLMDFVSQAVECVSIRYLSRASSERLLFISKLGAERSTKKNPGSLTATSPAWRQWIIEYFSFNFFPVVWTKQKEKSLWWATYLKHLVTR